MTSPEREELNFEDLQELQTLFQQLTEAGWTLHTMGAFLLYSNRFFTSKERWAEIDAYVYKRLADYPRESGSVEVDQALVFMLFHAMMSQLDESKESLEDFQLQLHGLREVGAQVLASEEGLDELHRVMLILDQQHIITKLLGGYNDVLRTQIIKQRNLLRVAHHFENETLH
ncbi:MAG: hypothetical protein VYD19_05975 [Myxococcota bacterium]|nr:hypothetical protein [Myxococcota bacterium]